METPPRAKKFFYKDRKVYRFKGTFMFYREQGEHFDFDTFCADDMEGVINGKEMLGFIEELRYKLRKLVLNELKIKKESFDRYDQDVTHRRNVNSIILYSIISLFTNLIFFFTSLFTFAFENLIPFFLILVILSFISLSISSTYC